MQQAQSLLSNYSLEKRNPKYLALLFIMPLNMRCLVSNDVNCIIDLTFLEVLKKDSRYDMKDYRLYLAPVYWDRVRSSRERGGGRDFETVFKCFGWGVH